MKPETMNPVPALPGEKIRLRDQLFVLLGLVLITTLCWVFLIHHVGSMTAMRAQHTLLASGTSPHGSFSGTGDFLRTGLFWMVMMTGMMRTLLRTPPSSGTATNPS